MDLARPPVKAGGGADHCCSVILGKDPYARLLQVRRYQSTRHSLVLQNGSREGPIFAHFDPNVTEEGHTNCGWVVVICWLPALGLNVVNYNDLT